nr:MAG TPA: hypothetical protein [Caudoviricetes sp.]
MDNCTLIVSICILQTFVLRVWCTPTYRDVGMRKCITI